MSSGGFSQPSGTSKLRQQLDSTILETDRFLETLEDKLAQHDREYTLFTPASEYLKGSMEHVRNTLDEVKGDAGRMDAEQATHTDREALAMSLDGLSCAVESLTHFARAFDEHKRAATHGTSHKAAGTQQPSGAKTQDSVEKLVRSVLTHFHLGFNTLQRSLGQVEHHGDPLHRKSPQQQQKKKALGSPAKPGRARQNSLVDDGEVRSFGHEGLMTGHGCPGRVEFADHAGLLP